MLKNRNNKFLIFDHKSKNHKANLKSIMIQSHYLIIYSYFDIYYNSSYFLLFNIYHLKSRQKIENASQALVQQLNYNFFYITSFFMILFINLFKIFQKILYTVSKIASSTSQSSLIYFEKFVNALSNF